MAITFAFLHIYGICFVRVHSMSLYMSQGLALLSRCCSISVSRPASSKPAAFAGFNMLRPVASSARLKGLVSSVQLAGCYLEQMFCGPHRVAFGVPLFFH